MKRRFKNIHLSVASMAVYCALQRKRVILRPTGNQKRIIIVTRHIRRPSEIRDNDTTPILLSCDASLKLEIGACRYTNHFLVFHAANRRLWAVRDRQNRNCSIDQLRN